MKYTVTLYNADFKPKTKQANTLQHAYDLARDMINNLLQAFPAPQTVYTDHLLSLKNGHAEYRRVAQGFYMGFSNKFHNQQWLITDTPREMKHQFLIDPQFFSVAIDEEGK